MITSKAGNLNVQNLQWLCFCGFGQWLIDFAEDSEDNTKIETQIIKPGMIYKSDSSPANTN